MEILINIAIAIVLLAIVLFFLKSPREISTNLLKGALKLPLHLLPFLGPWIYKQYKTNKRLQKEADAIEQIVEEKDNPLALRIDIKKFDCYLIIAGDYPKEVLAGDFQNSVKQIDQSHDIGWTYHKSSEYAVLNIHNLPNLQSMMFSLRAMSKLYGTTNTFGFLSSEDRKVFLYPSSEYPENLVGKTSDDTLVFYSLRNAREQKDSLLYGQRGQINHKLNTHFFEQLISSAEINA
jgi:hypothetical protein